MLITSPNNKVPTHVHYAHRPGSMTQYDALAGLRTRSCYHCYTAHKHPFHASGCTNVSASAKPIDAILRGRLHPAPQSHRINNPAAYHTSTILSNRHPPSIILWGRLDIITLVWYRFSTSGAGAVTPATAASFVRDQSVFWPRTLDVCVPTGALVRGRRC